MIFLLDLIRSCVIYRLSWALPETFVDKSQTVIGSNLTSLFIYLLFSMISGANEHSLC